MDFFSAGSRTEDFTVLSQCVGAFSYGLLYVIRNKETVVDRTFHLLIAHPNLSEAF